MKINCREPRIIINYPTDIISRGNRFGGIIANLSRGGVGLYILNPTPTHIKYCIPGSFVLLEIDLPSGDTIALECKIKWQRQNRSLDCTMLSMGMTIFGPSAKYVNFLASLNETLFFSWEDTAMTCN